MSSDKESRARAERQAVNAVVQGSAADLCKQAMINIARDLAGTNVKMLVQVHDELVFDVLKDELNQVKSIVEECMAKAYALNVPMLAEAGVGDNWLEAH
jgi:DNA polymerase-1